MQSAPPHPAAPNGNSGADPLTQIKVIPHHLLFIIPSVSFQHIQPTNNLILFITTAKKPQKPKTKAEETEFIFFKPELELRKRSQSPTITLKVSNTNKSQKLLQFITLHSISE